MTSQTQGGVTLSPTYNLNGNMTSDGVNTYSWTFGNRMSGATGSFGTATYAYDADNRRTRKTVNGTTTRYLWSGSDELGDYNASGGLIRRFVPTGTGTMDDRLAVVDSAGTVAWFHTDHQGSVIAMTLNNGQTIGTANYSPYGEFGDGISGPPAGSYFGYTGRLWDPETGLYQYRARYYSPRLGVFLSTDPIGTKDDPNLYLYVGLDPVNGIDPTGMSCTQNDDGQGYTCRVDNPGELTGDDLDHVNDAYTRAVNRLMFYPDKAINVTIGDGRGGTMSRSTTQGEVAAILIAATVGYENNDGSNGGRREPSNAEYTASSQELTLFNGVSDFSDRRLGALFIHEGMHGTDMNEELKNWFANDRRWYEISRDWVGIFNREHQYQGTEIPGYTGAATRAYLNWRNP